VRDLFVLGRRTLCVAALVARLLNLLLAQILGCPVLILVRHPAGGSSTIPSAVAIPDTSITRSTSLPCGARTIVSDPSPPSAD
jgi:hypothetical protein